MIVFQSDKKLQWGDLEIPVLGLMKDWYEKAMQPVPMYALAVDDTHLWFLAAHDVAPHIHPGAECGQFVSELWKYDVAEFFIASGEAENYLEINLCPNGAWWSCEFSAPRVPASPQNLPIPDVQTFSDFHEGGAWLAAFSVPLELLEARLGDRNLWKMNVTMILHSPEQKFFSAAALPGEKPNFHQPTFFTAVKWHRL